MIVWGIDFTSRPSRRKPLTCFEGVLDKGRLSFTRLSRWSSFEHFEDALSSPGPWIAGIDFPFDQARRFIENIGWPTRWEDYVELVGSLDRQEFRDALTNFSALRPYEDREYRRATDVAAGSISPQKLFGVPVGLMFFEGAPRLIKSGVTIPPKS